MVLESKRQYTNWIKDRIEKYGFVEGVDFISLNKTLVSGGSQNDHFLSVPVAKEPPMVENNEALKCLNETVGYLHKIWSYLLKARR